MLTAHISIEALAPKPYQIRLSARKRIAPKGAFLLSKGLILGHWSAISLKYSHTALLRPNS